MIEVVLLVFIFLMILLVLVQDWRYFREMHQQTDQKASIFYSPFSDFFLLGCCSQLFRMMSTVR